MKKLRILNNIIAVIITTIIYFTQLSKGYTNIIECLKIMVIVALALGISETLIEKLISKITKKA